MLFNSIEYMLFFPVVLLIYYCIPGKTRLYFLLVCSYLFYMGWNASYSLLLFFCTAVTFIIGLLIGRAQKKNPPAAEDTGESEGPRKKPGKVWVIVGVVINLAILFFFKYFLFTVSNINVILKIFGKQTISPRFEVLLPVGISFYIFQALSYIFDVYNSKVRVEKNFFKYAVFVSFFPQLVAGPIERSSNLLCQYDEPKPFKLRNLTGGFIKMIWGFFLKIVIADRAALLVNQVFNFHAYYSGFESIIAMAMFGLQIYGDFAGYSWIAIGSAQALGFKLSNNFRQPYFAVSVPDFWRRWHISLSSWFRDYLYIPLGGNRKGTFRKYLNILIVFTCSGMWHGAAWTYIIWGLLHGVYQVIGGIISPALLWFEKKVHMRTESFSHHLLQIILTFIYVDVAWVFFRASSVSEALDLLRSVFVYNPWIFVDGSLTAMGLSTNDWVILLISICILIIVSIMCEKGIHPIHWLYQQELWFRWGVCIAAILFILAVGIYGPGFNAASFIYFQF